MSVGSNDQVSTLADFKALSSEMAKVSPTGPNSASYSPTNSPQACPTIDSSWEATSDLPPSPNQGICQCMVANLTCVAKSDLSDEEIETQFDYVCDPAQGNNCAGIHANATTGDYGAFSMCNASQQLSFAYNQYYLNQTASNSENNSPCDFKGTAQKVSPKPASGCRSVLSQAGAAGTGTVTNPPVATGGASGSGSSSGSGSGSSSSHSGAAGVVTVPAVDFGLIKLAAYVSTAILVGAGFVML